MKYLLFLLLFFLQVSIIYAQNEQEIDSLTIPEIGEQSESGLFVMQVGSWLPIGNLSKTMGLSPHFGVWFGNMTLPYTNLKLSMGFNIFVPLPSNTSEFNYFLSDTILIAKPSSACGLMGIQLSQTQWIKNGYQLDFIAGVGIGFISTNQKKPQSKGQQNNENNLYSVDNVYFSLGVNIRKGKIGFNALFNITPLGSFEQTVRKNFGNQSITTGINYRFQF
jgi:hypothetical protein